MTTKLKPIDGNDHNLAPRPSRTGLCQIIYDVLMAWEILDFAGIWQNLPAAIMDSQQIFKRTQIRTALYRGVYNGFFIHIDDPKDPARHRATYRGKWKIAPRSYYDARKEHIANLPRVPRKAREPEVELDDMEPRYIVRYKKLDRAVLVITGGACLMVGFVLGVVVAVVLA